MFTQGNAPARVTFLEEIQAWLNEIPGQSRIPQCNFLFTNDYTILSIDEITIWCSEDGYADESIALREDLTLELVKQTYKKEIENLALVLQGG